MRTYLHSKIHKATVTEANLHYTGSITIDRELMGTVDLHDFEKVLVVDNTNGARLETYVIPGEPGSGTICMNGAAAHLVAKGDEITIMSFVVTERPPQPKAVLLDGRNRVIRRLYEAAPEPVP